MIIQKDQKKIISILKKIYRQILTKQNIDLLKNEIVQLIEDFNKKNRLNKINISEKTSLVISYGDNIYSSQSSSMKIFQKFFQKNLEKLFDTIHFLPFLADFGPQDWSQRLGNGCGMPWSRVPSPGDHSGPI